MVWGKAGNGSIIAVNGSMIAHESADFCSYVIVPVSGNGSRAFGSAPRLTIINCQLCQELIRKRTIRGKAFCLCKTAPPSTPVCVRFFSKKKNAPLWVHLFFLEQETGVEPADISLGS